MSKLHNVLDKHEDGTQAIRKFKKEDQPCMVAECTSNEGCCMKRFFAGNRPEGYGTTRCPGYIRISKATQRPTSVGFRPVKKGKPKRTKSGKQLAMEDLIR
ncbi:MAG: hypothetical protein WC359_13970 [Dehalococcoidia bacterium]